MFRKATVGVLVVAAFAAGSVATAATGWRAFATAADNDDIYASASANAKAVAPRQLAIRVTGDDVESVTWWLSCQGESKARKNGITVVAVGTADTCDLNANASGEGAVRLQLLRK